MEEQEEKKEKASGLEVAKYSVMAGLDEFNKGVASTLDFLAPTDFLGKYDPFSNLNDFYTEKSDYRNQQLEDALSGYGKGVRTAAEIGKATAAALPNALLAMMTGGGSLAASGSAALKGAAASTGKTGLAASVKTAVGGILVDIQRAGLSGGAS